MTKPKPARRADLRPYVLTWQAMPAGNNDLCLHGPFSTAKDAVAYGQAWQITEGDDPSWQVVMLHVPADRTIRLN